MLLLFLDIFNLCSGLLLFLSSQERSCTNMRLLNIEIGQTIQELLKFSQWISSVISHNGLDVTKLFKIKQKLQK